MQVSKRKIFPSNVLLNNDFIKKNYIYAIYLIYNKIIFCMLFTVYHHLCLTSSQMSASTVVIPQVK